MEREREERERAEMDRTGASELDRRQNSEEKYPAGAGTETISPNHDQRQAG